MRLYFDSAYVAKCYLNEPEGKAVRTIARSAAGLFSSALSIAELACVLLRHVREGKMTGMQADRCRSFLLEDVQAGTLVLFPVSEHLLYRVESLCRTLPSQTYLRAGDAIHLVSAREAGFTQVWSNDRHLLAAARYFGLEGKSLP